MPLQPAVTANDLCDLDSQACPPDLIPGSEGWARRRQEHVKAVLGEETPDQVRGRLYRTLEALIRWCWGAPVEEARAGLPLGRSGFYWRLEQALTRLPQLLEDGRCHNGRRRTQVEAPTQPEAEMEEEIAGRIVEMVVGQPGLSPAQVSQRLQEQDGTWSDPQRIADYLCQARLVLYAGSPYRQEALPTLEVPDGRSSRYAAQLLSVPALERLGLYEAAPQLSVDAERALYGPVVRCHTLLFALGSGKSRLSQSLPWTWSRVGELVEDEFARLLGEERYPQRSELQGWLERIVARDQAQAQQGLPPEARIVGHFVRQSQKLLARTAPAGAGRSIYVDLHTIALHTARPVPKAKHGMRQRIVKALVLVRNGQ